MDPCQLPQQQRPPEESSQPWQARQRVRACAVGGCSLSHQLADKEDWAPPWVPGRLPPQLQGAGNGALQEQGAASLSLPAPPAALLLVLRCRLPGAELAWTPDQALKPPLAPELPPVQVPLAAWPGRAVMLRHLCRVREPQQVRA